MRRKNCVEWPLPRAGRNDATGPGRSIDVVRGADIVVPREVVSALAEGTLSQADWAERATALGLSGLALRPGDEATATA